MITKRFQTVEDIDTRIVWLNKEIGICETKAGDSTEPNRQKFKTRAVNLRHEKTVLERRRQFLLTPLLVL